MASSGNSLNGRHLKLYGFKPLGHDNLGGVFLQVSLLKCLMLLNGTLAAH